jgi:hypothetical protein
MYKHLIRGLYQIKWGLLAQILFISFSTLTNKSIKD